MGSVHAAWHPVLAVPVAVKVLHEHLRSTNLVARFVREARVAARVDHPNLVRSLHAGIEDGVPFIVMELVEGPSLAKLVREHGRLPEERALSLALDVARGLGEAHRRGFVHRDVKPENVLVRAKDDRAKLADLGLARAIAPSPEAGGLEELSAPGTVMGTPAYMAPEQIEDSTTVGPAADVYSLGATLYEILAGRAPFRASSVSALFRKILADAPEPLDEVRPDVSRATCDLVARALAKDPSQRFVDGGALARALEDALVLVRSGEVPAVPARIAVAPRVARPARRPLVGRRSDLAAIDEAFARGDRLVTVWGPGGAGKTRLALEVAAGSAGSIVCELAEARTLEEVCATFAAALGVALAPARSAGESVAQLGAALAARDAVLVVLDNLEQVVAHAAATVERWLALAPQARFLATSRELLRLRDETPHELLPLAPDEGAELFRDRARAARGKDLDEQDRSAIAEVVATLEGMPLAIELAAARLRVLSLAALREMLPRRFEVLAGGARDAQARHETLERAIDWSWQLLAPHERSALAQCSVFRGGFDFEAARAVVALPSLEGSPWLADVLQGLVDRSLLRSDANVRLGFYESIRLFAERKLDEDAALAKAARERHARHFLAHASLASAGLDAARLDDVARERENLIAALDRACASTAATTALEVVLALEPLLVTRGPLGLHLELLDRALACAEEGEVPLPLFARTLETRGRILRVRGRAAESRADLERALGLAKGQGDARREASALFHLGTLDLAQGKGAEARDRLERALAGAERAGDRALEGMVLGNLATQRREAGHADEARALYERAIARHEEGKDDAGAGIALGNLGILLEEMGRFEDARAAYERALAVHRRLGNRRSEGITLGNLALLCTDEDRLEESCAVAAQALAVHREVGNRRSEGFTLGNLADVQRDLGFLEESRASTERALELFREVGDARAEANYRENRAFLAQIAGRHEEARALFAELADVHRRLGNRRHEGLAEGALGVVLLEQRRLHEASEHLARAVAVLRDVREHPKCGRYLAWLGAVEALFARDDEARRAFDEARTLAARDPRALRLVDVLAPLVRRSVRPIDDADLGRADEAGKRFTDALIAARVLRDSR